MKAFQTIVIKCLALVAVTSYVDALSAPASESANMARMQLQQSLSSIANKLTLSPEIIIPEPTDPTALLLQSTEVTKLSHSMRNRAKANAAFVAGSLNSVKTFCVEQETARGNFPGPLPVIYCDSSFGGDVTMSEISEAGATGVMYSLLDGNEIGSADEVQKDDGIKASFDDATENGMQLIPEVVLKPGVEWDEESVSEVVKCISEQCGADPVAVIMTLGAIAEEDDESEDSDNDGESNNDFKLPAVPKDLAKKIPILGSVRAVAGGGRMGDSVNGHKESGFKGCILRCDCLPGYRMNPDLDFVGGFWGAAIGDLKSTRSKNFNFRSEIALERDIPMAWYNYQKDVMESGALGTPGGGGEGDPLDTDNGDYKGF